MTQMITDIKTIDKTNEKYYFTENEDKKRIFSASILRSLSVSICDISPDGDNVWLRFLKIGGVI